jgi:DnaK suppressor protein
MDQDAARARLTAERADVVRLLAENSTAGRQDREAEQDTGDEVDPGTSLTAEGVDDAVAETLRNRLAAIEGAVARLDAGTYGRSVLSGEVIPDERLEADPAAELTVAEASAAE